MTTTGDQGAQHSELFCLATTLLDPDAAPIEDIPALYHDRWRGETMPDAVKTDLRGGADVLARSQHPDGVRQEMWALFCLYQALADLVGDAGRHHRTDPDRISFLRAHNAARRSVPRIQAGFPPHRCNAPVNAPGKSWADALTTGQGDPARATKRRTHRYHARGDQPATRRVTHTITLHRIKPPTSQDPLRKRHWDRASVDG